MDRKKVSNVLTIVLIAVVICFGIYLFVHFVPNKVDNATLEESIDINDDENNAEEIDVYNPNVVNEELEMDDEQLDVQSGTKDLQ